MMQRLSQLKSDLEYDGPAVYINIIGAGVEDDAAFFRLYIGQALNLRKRVKQHHDPKYRRTHPSLQYHMIDCRKQPLVTICMGTLPKLWVHRDGDTEFVLNILEKLGTLLFQTLPARLLAQFEVQAIYPNVHFNVLSPLFQSQGSRPKSKYIEEATAFIQETDDQQMLDYYRQKARGNPLKTLIFERAMEKKGGIPHNFDTLPEVIKTYLSERGFKNEGDSQALIAPGATLVLSILWVMKDLSTGAEMASRSARARQASQIANDALDPIVLAWEAEENQSEHIVCEVSLEAAQLSDEGNYVRQLRRPEVYQKYDSSSLLAPLMRGPIDKEPHKVPVHCSQCRKVRKLELNPQYERSTGYFVVRKFLCNKCETGQPSFVPIDDSLAYTKTAYLYNRNIRKAI